MIGVIYQNELNYYELSKNERGARQSSSVLERNIVCLLPNEYILPATDRLFSPVQSLNVIYSGHSYLPPYSVAMG